MSTRTNRPGSTVRVKTQVKAGGLYPNHNRTRIKTKVKAGAINFNHNLTRARA